MSVAIAESDQTRLLDLSTNNSVLRFREPQLSDEQPKTQSTFIWTGLGLGPGLGFGLLVAMIGREKFVLGKLPFPSAIATVEVMKSYRGCPATVDACMGSGSNDSEVGEDVTEEDEAIRESEQGQVTNTSYEDRGIDPPGLPQESILFRQGIFVNSLAFS